MARLMARLMALHTCRVYNRESFLSRSRRIASLLLIVIHIDLLIHYLLVHATLIYLLHSLLLVVNHA